MQFGRLGVKLNGVGEGKGEGKEGKKCDVMV